MMTTRHPEQAAADVAVVITTVLRASLLVAVRSVFMQEFDGRIHLLIGVDVAAEPRSVLDVIREECPPNVTLTIIDFDYSTAQRNGGLYSNRFGGALPTIATYAANSRYVAYLDDDDWWARDHLASLLPAIAGKQWAFANRWMVDPHTLWPICPDEWDAVGPGKGINLQRFGGFVAPSGLMIDKIACHAVVPLWTQAAFRDGEGNDRLVFDALHKHFAWGVSHARSVFYVLNAPSLLHEHHASEFRRRNIAWVADRTLLAQIEEAMAAARGLLVEGRPADAASQCRRVLAIHPYCADALHLMALAAQRQGNHLVAQDHVNAAIAVEDRKPAYFATAALTRADAGDLDGARRLRDAACRRFGREAVPPAPCGQ